jgi:hypothetical protein
VLVIGPEMWMADCITFYLHVLLRYIGHFRKDLKVRQSYYSDTFVGKVAALALLAISTILEQGLKYLLDGNTREEDQEPLGNVIASRVVEVQPFVYKSTSSFQPFLPTVQIFSEYEKFWTFCTHPDYFTAFRSYCLFEKRDQELQFILEMVHLCDYVCQGFLNANSFFDDKQIKFLWTFRQIPRSILVVNGRFVSSAVLPPHVNNENPEAWVANATVTLFTAYLLPQSRRQLSCTKQGWCGPAGNPSQLCLRARLDKLIDCMACSYATIERIVRNKSVEQIKREVDEETEGAYLVRSASMRKQWESIREIELSHDMFCQAEF